MKEPNCSYHPGTGAWGICSRCGRDLCYDCFLHYERKGFCPQCEHRFLSTILKLKSYLFNPVSVLILTIGLSSLLYLTVGGEKTNLTEEHSPQTHLNRKNIALRNWLYLGKAVRLRLYADHLKEINQAGPAKHSYYRARLALQQVLQGTSGEHPAAAMDTQMADESIREYLGELLISIAACYRGEQQTQTAIGTLNRVIEISPESDRTSAAGLAYYNLGRIYEEDIKNYEKAISMYKAAQKSASKRMDFLENMLTFLEKPVSDKRIATVVRQLAGSYDPAEAQSRVIVCYQQIGVTDKIAEEQKALSEQYPFSKWAIEARKAAEPEKEEVKEETRIEKEKETMKIIPLGDDEE